MIEKYHNPIYKVLSEKGALGVNAIAKYTDLPLSTVQRYLTVQQKYFRKTDDRKWDLPDRVNSDISDNTLIRSVGIVESTLLLLQTQLTEAQATLESALNPLKIVKKGVESKPPSVADSSPNITNKKLLSIIDTTDRLPEVIKARKSFIPDEYYEVLIKTSWLDLILDLGDTYVNDVIQPELYELLSGSKTELDEDLVNVLKNYQM